jgi:hypothetical protein
MISHHRPIRFTADFRFSEHFRHVGTQVRRPAAVFLRLPNLQHSAGGPCVGFSVGYLSLAHKAPNCASAPVWVFKRSFARESGLDLWEPKSSTQMLTGLLANDKEKTTAAARLELIRRIRSISPV